MLGLDVSSSSDYSSSNINGNDPNQTDSKTEHIWQLNDLDPNSVSIYCITRSAIKNNLLFKSFVQETEKQTNCTINLYGLENNSELIWIKIKNCSSDSRESAFNLINAITKNSCKEIILPKPSDLIQSSKRKTVCIVDNPPVVISQNKNVDELQSITTNYNIKPNKKPLVRSKTENAISSINKNNNKNNNSNKIIEQTKNLCINSDKKRYTLEFLLSRSDMAQSQKMPDNWKILNQLYPDVCFNGKIISYFNPNKYFAHWNKVKLQNSELHSFNQTTPTSTTTTTTTTSSTRNHLPHSKSFHSNRFITNQTSSIPSSSSSTSSTDDYLNLKSNNFDSYLKQQTRFIIDTNNSNNNNNNNKRNIIIHQNVQQQKRFDINHKNSIFNVTTNKNISRSINNNNNNNGINQTLFNNTAAHASATNAFKYNDRKNIKFSNY